MMADDMDLLIPVVRDLIDAVHGCDKGGVALALRELGRLDVEQAATKALVLLAACCDEDTDPDSAAAWLDPTPVIDEQAVARLIAGRQVPASTGFENRREAVRRMLVSGRPQLEIAWRAGCSDRTVSRISKALSAEMAAAG